MLSEETKPQKNSQEAEDQDRLCAIPGMRRHQDSGVEGDDHEPWMTENET